MANHPQLDWLETDGWVRIDIYARDSEAFGGAFGDKRPDEMQRDIYTNQMGGLIEVTPDGRWDYLVKQMPLPLDAPLPLRAGTERAGVIAYMAYADFETDLGGSRVPIYAKPTDVPIAVSVVEVEVIGRQIVERQIVDQITHLPPFDPEYINEVHRMFGIVKPVVSEA